MYGNCQRFKPITGIVQNYSAKTAYLDILRGKEKFYFDSIDLGDIPAHIKDNLNTFLLKNGNNLKIWGLICGSGGFLSPSHIVKIQKGISPDTIQETRDSIGEINPNEIYEYFKKVEHEIDEKVKKIRTDFDKEIAPNIPTGEKGEFETTAEAKLRVATLDRLRSANSSILWKKIYAETNSLVNEYLKITRSFYTKQITATLGTYDADEGEFPIFIELKGEFKITVPRNTAPIFKKDFDKAKIFLDYSISDTGTGWETYPERIRVVLDGQTYLSDDDSYFISGQHLQLTKEIKSINKSNF